MIPKGFCKTSLIFLMVVAGGCADIYTARGVYHKLQTGETLANLAGRYRVPLQDLAELNNLEEADRLKVGRVVFIPGVRVGGGRLPGGYKVAEGKRSTGGRRRSMASRIPDAIEADHGRFSWPVEGEISSLYGVRRGRRHDGVDLRSPRGTPVRAADDGEVVYSKRLRGYGNLILLKHGDGFFTVYAHNAVNLVKKGAQVKRGQMISKVGSTGRATGPHLHFEVREGSKPRNPLFFLPKRAAVAKALEEAPVGGD